MDCHSCILSLCNIPFWTSLRQMHVGLLQIVCGCFLDRPILKIFNIEMLHLFLWNSWIILCKLLPILFLYRLPLTMSTDDK